MKRFFRKFPIHLPLFISGSAIILTLGLFALFVVLYPQSFVASFLRSVDERFGVTAVAQSKSQIEITRVEDRLFFEFKIDSEDQQKVEEVSKKLGVSTDWTRGVDLTLDRGTLDALDQYLPLKSAVEFEDNKIKLTSRSVKFLESALPKESITFATGAATVRVFHDDSQINVLMNNPKDLVIHATASGNLSVSSKVEEVVFSIADKIATIDLRLKHKSLDGEIVLK